MEVEGLEEAMSFLMMAKMDDGILLPNLRFISKQKNEVRHIFVVPLNMDPSKII